MDTCKPSRSACDAAVRIPCSGPPGVSGAGPGRRPPVPLLSVVVPFRNVERYVGACLESLRLQTLADLEVVLVDDGSTDGTRALVDAVAAADPRFRVIEQPNAG